MLESHDIEILLVEEDIELINFIEDSFKRCDLSNKVHVLNKRNQVHEYLNKNGNYKSVPSPDLILLSLNISGLNGRELLIEIKHNDEFNHIPIVLITSSEAQSDIKLAYHKYVSCCITKPMDNNQFMKIIESFESNYQ